MLNNIEEPNRPQMTLWSMFIACWKTKATDTRSEYVVHAFPRREWFHERTSMLRYTYSTLPVLLFHVISTLGRVKISHNCTTT